MDLFLCRLPGSRTTPKSQLLSAAELSGLTPRDNWRHPSAREFLRSLEHFAAANGHQILGVVPTPEIPGCKTTYSTMKTWQVREPRFGTTTAITWDSLTGDVHGDVHGSRWRPLIEAMPEVIALAYGHSEVHANNLVDQIALTFLQSIPSAPFCRELRTGGSYWLLVQAEHRQMVEEFFSILDHPIRAINEIRATGGSLTLNRIVESCDRGCRKMGRSAGYVQLCRQTHRELSQLVTQSA